MGDKIINKLIFKDYLYGFTQWGSSKQQIICRYSLIYAHVQMTATTKAKNLKYVRFYSLSINKRDQEKKASLESRHVFKALGREMFFLANGMCGIPP